jgi:outer membrane protein assembly factor BamB
MSGSVIIGNCVYGVDGQGDDKDSRLKCLDLETGSVKWASPQTGTGNLTAAGDRLLWITGGGELVVVEAKPGAYRELGRAQVSGGKHWTAPTIAHGRLYVRSAKGDLVCVDLRASAQ